MIENPLMTGLALVLIIEGMMPLLAPAVWRQVLSQLAEMSDKQLRVMGAVMLISGALLFHWIQA